MKTIPIRISSRYRMYELLDQGGMGAVYRAYDRLSGQDVALKRLGFIQEKAADAGDTSALVVLAREFQTVATLRHPNIISVYDYGFDEDRHPYFTMELLHGASDIRSAAADLPLPEKVRLLAEVLQALVYLHRHNLLHRDLKPGNILVTRTGQVKVLDFGLATHAEAAREVAGTLNYMAPELLRGDPVSTASDLYAFGVIACEVLTGHHPYTRADQMQFLAALLNDEPDLSGFPENALLRAIVERLLSKYAPDRYHDAWQVLVEISEALDFPVPQETREIRESFLQASKFVGREAQLEQLLAALDQAEAGHGSRWLVAGESGIGKSRLLEELRIRALTRGVDVVRGGAVSGGGIPFQMWRNIVRTLVLSSNLSDQEVGILTDMVPDIAVLLERDVPHLPTLSDDVRRKRLIHTVVDLFKRHSKPLILILEDLQWAISSLEVLDALNLFVPDLPLLVIGTYRSEESPDLPQRLPDMEVITLSRLAAPEISTLSSAMLGKTGKEPEVLDLLNRETEGNVFFLIEVIRALAEDAGRLTDIGRITLPHHVFAGGIEHVIRRRLERIPAWGQDALKLAAILGREIEKDVLQAAIAQPDFDLNRWLLACSGAGVLEIHEERWRFAHDKLRERVLEDLGMDRPALFQQAAQGLEAVHGSDPAYAGKLADLWSEAGADDAVLRYSLSAAPYLVQAIASYAEAGRVLQRALAALPDQPETARDRMVLLRWLGAVRDGTSHYVEAERLYQESMDLARQLHDEETLLQVLRGMLQVLMRRGKFDQASLHTREILEVALRLGDPAQIGGAHANIGVIHYYEGKLDASHACYERAQAYLTDTTDPRLTTRTYANFATLLNAKGKYPEARALLLRSLEIYEKLGMRHEAANALVNLGMNQSMTGNPEEALRLYQRSLDMFRSIGDRAGISICLYNQGGIYNSLGDYVASYHTIDESLQIRRRIHDLRGMLFCLDAQTENSIALDMLEEARAFLLEGWQVAAELNNPPLKYKLMLATSKLLLRQEAITDAAEVLGALSKRPTRTQGFENEVRRYEEDIRQQIDAALFDAAYQRGANRPLDEMIAHIQALLQAAPPPLQ